jgi:hypothetical protein
MGMWASLLLVRGMEGWELHESQFEPNVDAALAAEPQAVLAAVVADSDILLMAAGDGSRLAFRHTINPEGIDAAGELDITAATATVDDIVSWAANIGAAADPPWIAAWLERTALTVDDDDYFVFAEDGLWDLLDHMGIDSDYLEAPQTSSPAELEEGPIGDAFRQLKSFAQEQQNGTVTRRYIAARADWASDHWPELGARPDLADVMGQDAVVMVEINEGTAMTMNQVRLATEPVVDLEVFYGPTGYSMQLGADWIAVPDSEAGSAELAARWARRELLGS